MFIFPKNFPIFWDYRAIFEGLGTKTKIWSKCHPIFLITSGQATVIPHTSQNVKVLWPKTTFCDAYMQLSWVSLCSWLSHVWKPRRRQMTHTSILDCASWVQGTDPRINFVNDKLNSLYGSQWQVIVCACLLFFTFSQFPFHNLSDCQHEWG
mgnify:CR=1 FL=1